MQKWDPYHLCKILWFLRCDCVSAPGALKHNGVLTEGLHGKHPTLILHYVCIYKP